jgi:hypothetical protein
MSNGKRTIRRRRKRSVIGPCKTCLAGVVATLVSGSLSVFFLPPSWIQVEYIIEPQKAANKVLQNVVRNPFLKDVHGHLRVSCPDGSYGWRDDFFCDCSDGSDEPNTSACSFRTVQTKTFSCNDGSGHIFASRVGDGVLDCEDGSDEI